MSGVIKSIAAVLLLLSPGVHAEDEMRDFYAEPGLNPFRSASGQDATEHIDPFSGNVQLSYVDLSIPGNGGLDINITRYYNLPQGSPGYANPFGYGWTMHFGRITIGSGHASQLCVGAAGPGGDTTDNPSIEMPSGGRELLVRSSSLDDGSYITRSNWKAACIDSEDYRKGLVATSPQGVSYYMREYVFLQGEDGPAGEPAPTVETWLTSRIVDAHGNSVDIIYLGVASGMKLAVRLEASDGRVVTLDYVDSNGSPVTANSVNARLSSISANGHQWRYQYAPVAAVASGWGFVDHYLLQAVVRPDGSRWQYSYGEVASEPDYRRLTKVRYPAGGEVDYRYQRVWPYLPQADFFITAIERKVQTNPGHNAGTWIYEFHPGAVDMADLGVEPVADNAGRMADFTRIFTPQGQEHVFHVGYWALVDTHNLLWQMGLKLKHQHLSAAPSGEGLQVVRSISSAWSPRVVSGEVYRGGILSALWDDKTYAAVLSRQSMWLDAYLYTTDFAEHDAFGNPGTAVESSIYPSENGSRTTRYSYRNDTEGWFIGLPETETVSQDGEVLGVISRAWGDSGLLLRENRFGVETQYTYYAEGDLQSTEDARGNVTRYSDYLRGLAQLEERADGSLHRRVVNPQGTVAAKISGRGHTTAFSYDGLNRLTGIDFPLGADVTVAWSDSGKVLTRGSYREAVSWDGFGRQVSLTRGDTATGDSFERHYQYDQLGRRSFESDLNSPLGVTRQYDVVGRVVRTVNQDGSDRRITHHGAHRELRRDEQGNVVEYLYQVYGADRERHLSWVIAPEGTATRITRDARGNIQSVFQGGLDPDDSQQYLGYLQYYSYNPRLQLTAIDSPADIGLTVYDRDPVGNMVSRQIGDGAVVLFSYDAMNRLSAADYADDSIDVAYRYDEDGNLATLENSYGRRSFQYDANGNLLRENVDIAQQEYALIYAYNALDHLSGLTYPSGREVDYAPDAMGKPSLALPYLSAVTYHSDGSLQDMHYANGRSMNFTRTSRNQVDRISIQGLLSLDYDYDPAGNVTALTNGQSPAENLQMTYDGMHRVTAVTGSWGTAAFDYDVYNNITRKNDPANGNREQFYQYLGLMLDRVAYSDHGAQRIFSYDDYGNTIFSDDVIFDVFTGAPLEVRTRRQHSFDDAGNLRFSSREGRNTLGALEPLRSGSFSSEYDGANNRIRKINHSDNNADTHYVYSQAGLLMGEYDLAGTYYGNEYFYLGDRQFATAKRNSPPQVDTTMALESVAGSRVVLEATAYDLDGEVVTHEWTQISGPEIVIDDPGAQSTFFTVPGNAAGATLLLQYVATDDRGARSSQQLSVQILDNQAPTANAGPDLIALPGVAFKLDGTASVDAEGGLVFEWSGDYLNETGQAVVTVVPPAAAVDYTLTFTLTVTDEEGLQDSDEVLVSVLTQKMDTDGDGLADNWERYYFGDVNSQAANDDPDGDGLSNLAEYREGSVPTTGDTAHPVVQVISIAGDASVLVRWERPLAAAGYDVYWSMDSTLPLSSWQRERVTETYFAHDGLVNGQQYHYVVRSFNGLGSAAESDSVPSVPGAREWRTPLRIPDLSAELDPAITRVATNKLGDVAVTTEVFADDVYRVYAWQYSPLSGWGEETLVVEGPQHHDFLTPAIDEAGNLMIAWVTGTAGERRLRTRYRARGESLQSTQPLGSYSADQYADGDVLELNHLEFSEDGRAFACWRQRRAHLFAGYHLPGAASAVTSAFDPIAGWREPRSLEVANNVGDTLSLSCDVSPGGRLIAAWGRHNTFAPQDTAGNATEYDVWVAAYDPVQGWINSETVEFLQQGAREQAGQGQQNYSPRVAAAGGLALVAWHNSSAVNIESLVFDFDAFAWEAQEVLESRARRIPEGGGHKVAANEDGVMVAAWGDQYVRRLSGEAGWERAQSLPATPALLAVDGQGMPYSVHQSESDVIANRFGDSGWSSAVISPAMNLDDKRLRDARTDLAGNMAAYWMSGNFLWLSSDAHVDVPPPADTAPVTAISLTKKKVKGATRYTLSLVSDKPGITYYRFTGDGVIASGGEAGAAWQAYSGQLIIQMEKGGAGALDFYSEDLQGNREITRTEVL